MEPKTIKLNVGGTIFETTESTIEFAKESPLHRAVFGKFGKPNSGIYFFDRDPQIFSYILNYYRTGVLWFPDSISRPLINIELDFWGVDENAECSDLQKSESLNFLREEESKPNQKEESSPSVKPGSFDLNAWENQISIANAFCDRILKKRDILQYPNPIVFADIPVKMYEGESYTNKFIYYPPYFSLDENWKAKLKKESCNTVIESIARDRSFLTLIISEAKAIGLVVDDPDFSPMPFKKKIHNIHYTTLLLGLIQK